MFTGIVEKTGTLVSKKTNGKAVRLSFAVQGIQDDMKLGDSVACNGVCLTVVDFGSNFVDVDVVPATLKSTSLGKLTRGCRINFERALRLSDRFGGHMVQGHVDGTGTVSRKVKKGKNVEFHIKADKKLVSQLVPKGSVAINGISLTIQSLAKDTFVVAIIPHTLQETNISDLKAGYTVNLEIDILSKYIQKAVQEAMKNHGRK